MFTVPLLVTSALKTIYQQTTTSSSGISKCLEREERKFWFQIETQRNWVIVQKKIKYTSGFTKPSWSIIKTIYKVVCNNRRIQIRYFTKSYQWYSFDVRWLSNWMYRKSVKSSEIIKKSAYQYSHLRNIHLHKTYGNCFTWHKKSILALKAIEVSKCEFTLFCYWTIIFYVSVAPGSFAISEKRFWSISHLI